MAKSDGESDQGAPGRLMLRLHVYERAQNPNIGREIAAPRPYPTRLHIHASDRPIFAHVREATFAQAVPVIPIKLVVNPYQNPLSDHVPPVPSPLVLHLNPMSKNILAKPECDCNMISAPSSPASPPPIDGPPIRGGENDKIQIPAFCGFTARIRRRCSCRFR